MDNSLPAAPPLLLVLFVLSLVLVALICITTLRRP
jgi:hypothetical protein